jgi:translation initiation factor 2 subunit 3
MSKSILGQLRRLAGSNLAFDPIKELNSSSYSGYIYDLTVPTRANFVAGLGAIICHNSTITQSITGVWTSAHSDELKRGITIKVGYADAAFYKCPGVDPPTCYRTDPQCPDGGQAELLRAVSFVDTSGH